MLVAADGFGKTMIARNILHNAILGGYSTLFITAAELLLDLPAPRCDRGEANALAMQVGLNSCRTR